MSEYLASMDTFIMHAEVRYDWVLDQGQKIEFGGSARAAVRRPNGLHIEYRGDLRNSLLVYDGITATILDITKYVYSVLDVPDSIDAAVDHIFDNLNFSVPIADMVYADPYSILAEYVIHGSLVGHHKIDGRPCHHLAFTQEQIDWQIWIEDGPRPVPRKLVVTYFSQEGAPQYSARFTKWVISFPWNMYSINRKRRRRHEVVTMLPTASRTVVGGLRDIAGVGSGFPAMAGGSPTPQTRGPCGPHPRASGNARRQRPHSQSYARPAQSGLAGRNCPSYHAPQDGGPRKNRLQSPSESL
jgi:hypothetical protein